MDLSRSSTPKPGTTVLVVGYNHQNYIGETLASIMDQTLPPAAVLITDDASPGQAETAKIVQSHLDAAPETWTWLPNESNMGLNATLNRLLALVDTEFVTYIAADDTMLSNRIEVQSSLLKDSGVDTVLAYSDAHVIDKDSRLLFTTSRTEFPWPDEPQRSNQTLKCLVESNWIPAASMFMRTTALREAGGYAEDLFYEDFELLLRLAKDRKFTHTEQPLVQVRRLDDSLGAQGFAQDSPRFLRAAYVALGHALDADDTAVARKAQSLRWVLAKRSIRSAMPRKESLAMLWSSKSGAKSPAHAAAHMVKGLLTGD